MNDQSQEDANLTRWPPDPTSLPYLLPETDFAKLRGCTPRTLQRERANGRGCPFRKLGKSIYYARPDVLAFIDVMRFQTIAEARRASSSPSRTDS